MQNEEKPEYWLGRIKEYQKSRMSINRWCDTSGEGRHKLRYWLEKFEADGTITKIPNRYGRIPEWLPLDECEKEVNTSADTTAINIHINSFRISVGIHFDKQALADIIEVLTQC
jgi:hypothetical protein